MPLLSSSAVTRAAFALLLILSSIGSANAHLMVAQQGTLNIVEGGAFMVLSLPTSAFSKFDDNGDNKLSREEFSTHQASLNSAVEDGINLRQGGQSKELQGLMLTPVFDEQKPQEPASQMIAMGRFVLSETAAPLEFDLQIFGTGSTESTQQVTVSRPADGRRQLLVFSAKSPTHALMASGWSTFTDYVTLGAEHIVFGFDHLLFLLVVLVTGWGWRHILLALSIFTLGHALTLTITSFYNLSLNPALIEPAIAATIVGMAALDLFNRHRNRKASAWIRLSAVFICALIHGLGLASALSDRGLNSEYLLSSLAGFNLGIEAGQLMVASLLALVAVAIVRLRGNAGLELARHSASLLAIVMGSFWFVQRVI
ncbi:HupE/UreJ family protein [Granulosicoccus antarcticus]|uniref:EF-hand domain-containing protein n=1 Tax=Granulosicoccus antarcticus IMCC3135 TaxID=1192854 RepID=A0A2Z2NYY9_9GAMM|nr:HupE/UreJ family protein [Granulosicoccus antarcticus]ASJ76513.1 hypothetical protein IMCC3135_32340 [Granulosicoccus antarcticus IMCC3135]